MFLESVASDPSTDSMCQSVNTWIQTQGRGIETRDVIVANHCVYSRNKAWVSEIFLCVRTLISTFHELHTTYNYVSIS